MVTVPQGFITSREMLLMRGWRSYSKLRIRIGLCISWTISTHLKAELRDTGKARSRDSLTDTAHARAKGENVMVLLPHDHERID